MIDGENCRLEVLDTAGSEEFSVSRDQLMARCEGFLIIYSITSTESLSEVSRLREFQILRVKESEEYIPIIIVGNKADLEKERKVSTKEGEDLAKSLGCLFMETSAKTRMNAEEVFFRLVREIRDHKPTRQDTSSEGTETTSKKGKCVIH